MLDIFQDKIVRLLQEIKEQNSNIITLLRSSVHLHDENIDILSLVKLPVSNENELNFMEAFIEDQGNLHKLVRNILSTIL